MTSPQIIADPPARDRSLKWRSVTAARGDSKQEMG
jgi:hypothetical protein